MNLRPTHHGYAYQDTMCGIAFVDLMLGTATRIKVDLKVDADDRFDDLTIEYAIGRRRRLQIKHTTVDRQLSRATFSGDGRSLRLDLLLRSLLDDLASNPDADYRVVVRDKGPDSELSQVLEPVDAGDDPGDPLPGVATRRYRFNPQKLRATDPWKNVLKGFTDDELHTACARLVIDTDAPEATLSFDSPGPAERALMRRAVEELGAGRPPNLNRSAEDVGLALLHAATGARAIEGTVTRTSLAPEVRLTTDFGAVRDGHPVEAAFAVDRVDASDVVRAAIDESLADGGRVVLTGEPGAGKTWLCEQLADSYVEAGVLVLRHHCWLGDADSDRNERVLAEVVIGSLLHQLEAIVPESVAHLRPRFAATPEALEEAIRACRGANPDQHLVIIVDGLDHIDRVLGRQVGGPQRPDPARALVDQLGAVALPAGVSVLIASQPGQHLDNAHPTSGAEVQMPLMSHAELGTLAEHHGVLTDPQTRQRVTDDEERTIVDLLHARSNGNALYATYLCRHATGTSPLDPAGSPTTVAHLIERLREVPENATDLDEYYAHLLATLTGEQEQAIGALALCDFALSKQELGEIAPLVEPWLDDALARLAPILNSTPGLGGLKVHHESFSRFIHRTKQAGWSDRVRRDAADWLTARGFFTDTRAFRHLPQLLAELGDYDTLQGLITPDFVTNAIAALQPPDAIKQVLTIVAHEAQARRDWGTLLRCLEARRGVVVYEHEALPDTLVEYADVVVGILGAEVVAERLVYDGRATFTARWGLRLCEAVDRAGAAAPWEVYLDAFDRQAETDNTSYDVETDERTRLAIELGDLRLAGEAAAIDIDELAEHFDQHQGQPSLRDLVAVLAVGIPLEDLLGVARKMTDPARTAAVLISLANVAKDNGDTALGTDLAREAHGHAPGRDPGAYLDHGMEPDDLLRGLGIADLDAKLREVTEKLLESHSADRPGLVSGWLNLLRLAHAIDRAAPVGLNSELGGEGFYRAWLRFAVATVGLEEDVASGAVEPEAASTTVRVALEQLATNSSHFAGNPRAVDLYSIHAKIHEVIERSLRVVMPGDLDSVMDHLTAIGDRTTSSLAGMAEGGPLATNDLLGILARVADRVGIEPIHRVLSAVREERDDTETMYSVTADFEVATARLCLEAGALEEAEESWWRAAALLGAYGGHKDITITEFIESVTDLAAIDLVAARAALARLQDPAYLVRQHTNGRETSHIPGAWWELAADIDPIAAATGAAHLLTSEFGFDDPRAYQAQVRLLISNLTNADPVVLAALRLTATDMWGQPGPDTTLLERLRPELGRNAPADAALTVVANNVAATYDNQPLMRTSDRPGTAAPAELIEAVRALGGPSFAVRAKRPEDETGSRETPNRFRETRDVKAFIEEGQRPILEAGAPGAAVAARDYNRQGYGTNAASRRWHSDALVNAVGWRVLEATSTCGAAAGRSVLDSVAREMTYSTHQEAFATLAEGLEDRCGGTIEGLEEVTSYCYALAYTRISARGGWLSSAGRERVELWNRAHSLNPDVAEQTLAAAIATSISNQTYATYGVAQGVVAAFAASPATESAGTAVEVWNDAFDVLEQRIPGAAARTHPPYVPGPVPDDPNELDQALATLALANIGRPKREDIRLSLLAAALLLTCRPALGQGAVVPLLGANLDAGRLTWLLGTVRDHLPHGELTDEFADVLTHLAGGSDMLSVRVAAGEILDKHGRAVPNPPATPADRTLRDALNEAWGE